MNRLYDFHCARCDTNTEKLTEPADDVITCPKCNGLAVRVITAPKLLKTNHVDKNRGPK